MEQLISKLAEHGVLGIVAGLAVAAVYKMFKLYEEVQEKRIAEGLAYQSDTREISTLLKSLTEKFHDVTEEMKTSRRRGE